MKRLFAVATAAGVALAVGFGAVPASAVSVSVSGPVSVPPGPSTPVPAGPSAAGLSEAVLRDLGMSLAEFNAAGALGRRAADAASSLRAVPGYVGIRLKAGKILVEGNGPALQARVNELNQAGPADFVLVSPPAVAPASPAAPALVAGDIDQLFQDYIRDVGIQGLQAVAYTDGHFVIRTGSMNTAESDVPATTVPAPTVPAPSAPAPTATAPAASAPSSSVIPGKLTPAQFVARYANVQLEKGAAIKTENDIFGGQGYFADNLAICSTGFGAFSPTGLPLVLTAGHCAEDGLAKTAGIEPTAWAPAGGAVTPSPRPSLAPLGTFGFSQFGGPNNSPATAAGSSAGADIAVIQAIAPGLNLQPAATTWGNPSTPDPVRIIGTTAPFQGQQVCRSGRTTGWKCGTVDAVGIWMMPGRKSVLPNYDNDLRPVRAFDSTSVKSAGGDSGGPWISGNFAVGTHTGAEFLNGTQTLAIAATLEDSMAAIPGGVQLQLFLNKPELVAPPKLTFAAGSDVTGRVAAAPASAVAAGSKVRITVTGQQPLEVPVDAAGNWSFKAPPPAGPLTFSAETVNGFSRSGAATLTAIIAPSSLSTPTNTTPATAPPPAAAPPAAGPTTSGMPAPAGDSAAVVRPVGDPAASLANTGASGVILAAGLAALVLVVGGVLLALARRRKRQPPTPTD